MITSNRTAWVFSAVVLLASFILFYSIFSLNMTSDLQAHITTVQRMVGHRNTIPRNANFLFYLTVYLAAFLHSDTASLSLAASIVLAAAVSAKYILTLSFFEKQIRLWLPEKKLAWFWLPSFSLLLIVAFSLPTSNLIMHGNYYLGQIPPNIWHNSTTIFLMPFALLLFFRSYDHLERPSPGGIVALSIFSVLTILVKPSFFFVFSLAYPLFILRKFGFSKMFWLNLAPVIIGLIVLGLQYIAIYKIGYANSDQSDRNIGMGFFQVWNIFTNNIPLSLCASVVFPMVYFALDWRTLVRNSLVQHSVVYFGASLLIFCIFIETGPKMSDGNFFWQTIVSIYLVFMVLCSNLITRLQQAGWQNKKNQIILAAFLLHVLSGVIYLIKFFISGKFV